MQSTATGDVDGGIGGSEILPLARWALGRLGGHYNSNSILETDVESSFILLETSVYSTLGLSEPPPLKRLAQSFARRLPHESPRDAAIAGTGTRFLAFLRVRRVPAAPPERARHADARNPAPSPPAAPPLARRPALCAPRACMIMSLRALRVRAASRHARTPV